MNLVFLALGSNKSYLYEGEELSPYALLSRSCEQLGLVLDDLKVSSVYVTKPMYVENQDNFYNMVVCGYYRGSPEQLLVTTQAIEAQFGRNRACEFRNGPRSLDIDIITFSGFERSTATLEIPHPKHTERAFVLVPMLELLEKYADTIVRDFYVECLEKLDSSDVTRYSPVDGGI